MRSIDYDFKSYIIEQGFHKLQKDISKAFYNHDYNKSLYTPYDYNTACTLQSYMLTNFLNEYKEACRINHASYSRKTRLQHRISNMLLNNKCVFITLTFTDSVLSSTSADTRRQYVRRTLQSFNVPYVANIDFGKENEREHYHAVVQIDKVPSNFWKYGFFNVKNVFYKNSDIRLAKYITKLTNHAIKETCHGSKCIYSRI